MRVDGVDTSRSFGSLYFSPKIIKKLGQQRSNPEFFKDVIAIKKVITDNKFDKKRYVDLLLSHKEGLVGKKAFYVLISPKKKDIPMHPDAFHNIPTDKKGITQFRKWLNNWNWEYSPKGLEYAKSLEETVKKLFSNK